MKPIEVGKEVMTPHEVVAAIKELGVSITVRTLHRYQKAGLVPTPKSGSRGQGLGAFAHYPIDTPAIFIKNWEEIHRKKSPAESLVAQYKKRIAELEAQVRALGGTPV